MKKNSNGQSLWEIIISLTIAGLIGVGLVKVTSSSVKSSRFSTDQSRMTALAQQKINQIIDYENNNSSDFWSGGGSYPFGNQFSEYSEEEGYCLWFKVSDESLNLPTETPNWQEAKMAKIEVFVYWDLKTDPGSQCDHKDFSHNLHFETYVTN